MDITSDKLRPDDLEILRETEARKRVLRMKPNAFTPDQAIAIEKDYFRVMGDIAGRYEVDVDENWSVSCFTGQISYHED